MNLFALQSWIFSFSENNNNEEIITRNILACCILCVNIYVLWCHNHSISSFPLIIRLPFFPVHLLSSSDYFLFFLHTLSLPSYPSCSLFPSLSLAAHFQIYEFLNIIFLIFPRLRETFSFQTFSFFTSFPPSWVWISQTGCEVKAWPVEVRAGVWGFSVCVRTCACMCVCWGRWKGLRWGV